MGQKNARHGARSVTPLLAILSAESPLPGSEAKQAKQPVDKEGRDTVFTLPFLGTDYAEYEVSRETRPQQRPQGRSQSFSQVEREDLRKEVFGPRNRWQAG